MNTVHRSTFLFQFYTNVPYIDVHWANTQFLLYCVCEFQFTIYPWQTLLCTLSYASPPPPPPLTLQVGTFTRSFKFYTTLRVHKISMQNYYLKNIPCDKYKTSNLLNKIGHFCNSLHFLYKLTLQ